MSDDWNGHAQPAWSDESGEQPWSPEASAAESDAWRGDASDDADSWRGDVHPAEWPTWNAGPEYLMWKRIAEEE